MRTTRSDDERERLELHNRNRMRQRALNKGVTLPDDRRGGMRQGGGSKQGNGQGGGHGGGQRRANYRCFETRA